MRLAFLRSLVLLLVLLAPLSLQAQSIAVHDLAVLVDADGSQTIATVSSAETSQRFTPLDGLLNAGFTHKVHWLRFSVQVPSAGPWWLEVLPPVLDDLRLFEPGDAGFSERRSGDLLPFASREDDYRGFIFKLALPDIRSRTFYLRVQTTSSSMLMLQLWQPDKFRSAKNLEYMVMGLLFGFFLLVVLLNVTLWVGTRESLYGWFSLFAGSSLLLHFTFAGGSAQYLLHDAPLIADALVKVSTFVFLACGAPFYRRMLNVERDQILEFNAFRAMVVLPCVLSVSVFTGHYLEAARIALGFSGASGLLILYFSFKCWRQGQSGSRYLLLATAMAQLNTVSGLLFMLGFIPGNSFLNVLQFQRWVPMLITLTLQAALAIRVQESNKEKQKDAQRGILAEREAVRERDAQFERARVLADKNAVLEQLQQAEQLARATVDALSASLAILDESGTIITVNRVWRRFAQANGGEPAHVCEGVNYLAVCDAAARENSADAAEMAAGIRQVLQGERDEFTREYACDSPTEARWFVSRVRRFSGAGPIRAVVAHEDITERRRAEAVVRKLSRALEQSPAAVVITDRAGDIEYVNSQFETQTGYAMAEVLGRNPRMLQSGRTPAQTFREMWSAIATRGEWRGELCNRRKDGQLLWESAAISRLTDENGRVSQYVAVKEDITERKKAVEALRQARHREVEVASGIQRSFPGEVPHGIEGAWLAAYADPAQVIDGDFYAIRRYRPACFEVLVADVMGKGVPAALMGAGIAAVYSNMVADLLVAGGGVLPKPAAIVNAMHRALTPKLMALSAFATLALYRFDLEAGTLTWVNAGHTPGLLTTGPGARPVAILGDNLPIGVMPNENYVERSVAAGPGCSLLVFSDGITEARSPQDEEFGLARLSDLIEAGINAKLPPQTIMQALRGEQRRFIGGAPGADDLTAVMVTLHPLRGVSQRRVEDRIDPFVFTLPWSLEGLWGLRARIEACAGSLPKHDADALVLASFEAATNIIRHAQLLVGDATLTCRITRESDALVVELIYPSVAFTPPAEIRPDMSGQSEGGFGLYIIEQSVDSVEYSSPMPGVASIRLVKHAGTV